MDPEPRRVRVDVEIESKADDITASTGSVVHFYPRLLVDGRRFAGSFEYELTEVLDVEALFRSLREPGRLPLFTCTCGIFGCGGCWIDAVHTEHAWMLRNAYDPTDADAERAELVEEFAFAVPWDNVRTVAATIDAALERIRARHPGQSISNGFYGNRLDDVRLEPNTAAERTGD